MATKSKKGRGKTMNITEFAEDYIPDDAYDWADDDWKTEETKAEEKLAEKLGKQRREYSRTANNKLLESEGFRTAESVERASPKASIDDLKPPYVAHFGNLRNGVAEEDFLALFNGDVIVTHRLINQEGKSFAFVEFSTPQAIAVALLQDGQMFRGRKMYVDLATQKQVDRLLNRNQGPASPTSGAGGERVAFSRDGAGQSQPGVGLANLDLTRDAFGGEQQPTMSALPNNGSRSGFGSRQDLSAIGELSRNLIGSAVQQPMSPLDAHGGSDGSPTSAVSPNAFANWRSAETAAQPEFPALADRKTASGKEEGGSSNSHGAVDAGKLGDALAEARMGNGPAPARGAGGGSRVKQDAAPAAFGNWRDEPRTEQQQQQQQQSTPPASGSPSGGEGRRGGRGGGGGRGAGGANAAAGGGGGRGGSRGDGEKVHAKPAPAAEKDWGSLRR